MEPMAVLVQMAVLAMLVALAFLLLEAVVVQVQMVLLAPLLHKILSLHIQHQRHIH